MSFVLYHSDAIADQLLETTIERYHPHLVKHEVTVKLAFAKPTVEGEPALKLHGYRCAAIIRVVPYLWRFFGVEDAVILLDFAVWDRIDEASRIALLDHELEHIVLSLDENGDIRTDDHFRPKFKLKPHDWETGGFVAVAQRHGAMAMEVLNFRATASVFQEEFGFSAEAFERDEFSHAEASGDEWRSNPSAT